MKMVADIVEDTKPEGAKPGYSYSTMILLQFNPRIIDVFAVVCGSEENVKIVYGLKFYLFK